MDFHELTYMPMDLWTEDELHEWAQFLSNKMDETGAAASDLVRMGVVIHEIRKREAKENEGQTRF